MSCTAAGTKHAADGQGRALCEPKRVRRIENKSSSQRVFLVYCNSKSTRDGGVQGCRRLAFRLVRDLSPLRACPGADTKRHAGGPAAGSRDRRHQLVLPLRRTRGQPCSLQAVRYWAPPLAVRGSLVRRSVYYSSDLSAK